VLEETAAIGKETRQNIEVQKERLQGVENGLDRVDGNIRTANRQIRVFIRRMATDKLVMCLLILVILGVIACAIVPFVVKRK
jgi:SNARE protein